MSRNNLNSPFTERKYKVRLYKQGKHWVAMGVTLAALAGISFAAGDTANAAETTTSDATSTVSENPSTADSNTATLRATTNSNTPAPTPTKQISTAISNNQSDTPSTDPAATQDNQEQVQIVTDRDTKRNISTDPHNTGNRTPNNMTGDQIQKNFSTGGTRGFDYPLGGQMKTTQFLK